MRSLSKILLPFTLVLGLSAVASAQDDDEIRPDTFFEFTDGSDVTGEIDSPMGDLLSSRIRSRRVSLVRPRDHFVHELLKSIERI